MSKLSACPFCGSDRLHPEPVSNTGGNTWFIRCVQCSACGPWYKSTSDPAEKWNQREAPEISEARAQGWKQCDYPHASAKDMWTHDDHMEGKYEEMLEKIKAGAK